MWALSESSPKLTASYSPFVRSKCEFTKFLATTYVPFTAMLIASHEFFAAEFLCHATVHVCWCRAYFAISLVNVLTELLESKQENIHILGCQTLANFINSQVGYWQLEYVWCYKCLYCQSIFFRYALGFIFFGILSGGQHICTQHWKLGSQSMRTFTSTGRGAQASEGSKFAVFVSNGNTKFAFHFLHHLSPFSSWWFLAILFGSSSDYCKICTDLVYEGAFIHICWFWWGKY